MNDKHNFGLDLYRILCCLGVLIYHVIDDVLAKPGGGRCAYALYYLASYCVPGFFMLSGFLLGNHKKITLNYVEDKIIVTMKKLFAWIVLWSVLHFARTGEIYDLWEQLTAGIKSGGILPVSWFLFTYCFLLFLGYPLWQIKNKYPKQFSITIAIWILLLAAGFGKEVTAIKPQSLWLHLYIGYFALGMALTDVFVWVKNKVSRKKCVFCALLLIVVASIKYIFEIKGQYAYMAPHNYYGQWFYSLWLVGMFWICTLIKLKSVVLKKIIQKIAGDTMVVYLGHLPLLIYITSFRPIQNTGEAIVFIILLFVLFIVSAECMKKLPLLRKII